MTPSMFSKSSDEGRSELQLEVCHSRECHKSTLPNYNCLFCMRGTILPGSIVPFCQYRARDSALAETTL